ncbi:MAG: M6 family metalloprotease domain-containing protein, partial [Kiritimatiellales bacterium]
MKRMGFSLLLLGMLLPLISLASPYGEKGKAVAFTQPDGSVLDLLIFGDEFYAVAETLDGYTVVFDHTAKAYVYAILSADGRKLLTTAQVAGTGDPQALNASKHLRINVAEQETQAHERVIRWDAGMGIRAQWESIKSTRRALETTSVDGIAMAPPAFTTVGAKAGLTLLIDFDDDPATVAQTNIQAFCNAANYTGYGNNGSVRQYFFDNSNGQLDYTNVVTVYIRIPNSLHPKSWYNDTSKDCGEQANLLIHDAIMIMTNLPNYNTEILPTLNNLTVDGANQVIACNVFYAGGNGGVWSFGLWPHSWSLYSAGAQYLSPGGKKVYKYQITNIGASLELGTFCHENGHMLCGFPDIYDYGYDSIGGAGMFCLMNSGGHGANPVQICAYLKRASGWATTVELNTNSLLTAEVSSSGANFNRFYRYAKPGVATEYYLVENRQPAGRDANLPAGGVAIWHIDERGNRDNQSTNYSSTTNHYEVSLMQADNLWHFQKNSNSGDSKDLYYSGNTAAGYTNRFSDSTAPSARWWDGSTSGVNFVNFSATGTTMTFNVGAAVSIVVNPQSRTNNPGTSASFTVTVTGTTPLYYQWQKNATNIVAATTATYTIASVVTGDAGDYRCLVSNAVNAVTSEVASLTVTTAVSITGDPQSRTNDSGTSASFTVTATGSAPLYYQWQKNATNIVSATNMTYPIASVVIGDAGDYRCRVSNMVNAVTSGVASLTVIASPEFVPLGVQTAFVGTVKTVTVSATGYPAPALALQGTTASSGYGFTPGTGQLSYTPPQVDTGSQTFTFTASNSLGVATQVVNVTVNGAPVGGGMETFDNFTPVSSTYVSGTFAGQDGSVWTYANVRGDIPIAGKTPTIRNRRAAAYIRSGAISGGVASLTFKYRNPFNATAMNNKVYVIGQNSTYIGTVTAVPSTTNEVLTFTANSVNVAGNFTLLFTNTTSTAVIAIDDIPWTGYSGPVFSALGAQSATAGVAKVFAVSARGAPTPTLALQGTTASSGYSFILGTGQLNYTPPQADEGTRTFTFTASNSAGVATQVVTVTVSKKMATVTLQNMAQFYDG